MSAVVYIREAFSDSEHRAQYREVRVPDANHCHITSEGYLRLSVSDGYGEQAGLFKDWDHVVIEQRWVRGPGGRFVSKENR